MTKRERIYAALAHKPVDRIPKGELEISVEVAFKLLGEGYSDASLDFEREKAVRELLNIDFINIGEWPITEIGKTEKGETIYQSNYGGRVIDNGVSAQVIGAPFDIIEDVESFPIPDIRNVSGDLVRRFAKETDLFVFAQIGGVLCPGQLFGMEDWLVYCLTNPDEIYEINRKIMIYEIQKAKLFIDSGANGIIVGDDIAYNSGLFLPPYVMEKLIYPFYEQAIKEIKAYKDVPVILHTDGNINAALNRIVEVGFDGIQSLQPSAGMDIREVKEKYGDKLCLIGNIDLDYIMTFASPEEVRKNVEDTIRVAAKGSGFILSTCNMLVDVIPKENVLAMYETAENFDMSELDSPQV